MRESVRFLFGTEWREVSGFDTTRTALDWLRLDERKTGTKEGCAEGDCGACTIVVGRLVEGALRYEPVDACIRLLATLDGCHVFCVEHLRRADGAPHAVQQAMVDAHATQCGFCTPGFVMSLFALWLSDASPSLAAIEEALQGNLCRCTGYQPVVDAGRAMGALGAPDRAAFADVAKRAAAQLADVARQSLALAHDGRSFFAPTTLAELDALFAAHPDATILAGATDVGLWITKRLVRPRVVIWLGKIADLARIEPAADGLSLGACVTYAQARVPLAGLAPALDTLLSRIGGAQVRAMGTIGGNIANGSPIGDMPPALIALGARISLRSASGRRTLPLEDFFLDYGKQDRQPGDYVERIDIPKPAESAVYRVWKISKRRDEDISSVCAAFCLTRDASGRIASARIAFGGMAATPKRARAAEAALLGKDWTRATFRAAAARLPDDFAPIGDWRASAAYRMRVAQNLFERLCMEGLGEESGLTQAAHG